MYNFIYIFDSNSRDILIEAGYQLLRSDETNNIYVFVNKDPSELRFNDNSEFKFVYSNVLTF